MTSRVCAILLFLTFTAGPASASYTLGNVKERLVFLLELKDVKLDGRCLVFFINNIEYKFAVSRSWMQDRIWSDGICVGVPDSDPGSAAARIRQVQLALAQEKETLLLIELVCVAAEPHFIVSYLKLFDPAVEYDRYFPQSTYYDTIALPFNVKPADAESFTAELTKSTLKAQERLVELNYVSSIDFDLSPEGQASFLANLSRSSTGCLIVLADCIVVIVFAWKFRDRSAAGGSPEKMAALSQKTFAPDGESPQRT